MIIVVLRVTSYWVKGCQKYCYKTVLLQGHLNKIFFFKYKVAIYATDMDRYLNVNRYINY